MAVAGLAVWAPVVRGQETTTASLSPAAGEVVRMAQAGTGEDVLQAYVQNSASAFNLTADQILYLKDIGLPSGVVTAMINRDAALRGQTPPNPYEQRASPPTMPPPAPGAEPAPAGPVAAPAAPAPATATATAPVYVTSPPPEVNYFYSSLAPYGTWVSLEGVGWCWQPTVVVLNHGWRPYCHGGHWVYSDAGWYWASDYSWGWAPFHYGRWHMHPRCGWVWLPDRAWGPAWVTWRTAGEQCGWAPLPPHANFDAHLGFTFNGVHVGATFDFGLGPAHFTFVAMNDFTHHDLGHRCLPAPQVTRIYNQTTVINNYVVNNNVIVNQGVRVERVAAATHTEIRRAAIRDLPAGAPAPGVRAGQRTENVVYRQQPSAPSKPARMVAQKVDDRHPVIQPAPLAPLHAERKPAPGAGPAPTMTATRPQPAATRPAPERTTRERPPTTTVAPERAAQPTPPSGYAERSPGKATPASSGSSHVYYPKGYHQAAEIQSLPPATPPRPVPVKTPTTLTWPVSKPEFQSPKAAEIPKSDFRSPKAGGNPKAEGSSKSEGHGQGEGRQH
jgi:hypothetical protein